MSNQRSAGEIQEALNKIRRHTPMDMSSKHRFEMDSLLIEVLVDIRDVLAGKTD